MIEQYIELWAILGFEGDFMTWACSVALLEDVCDPRFVLFAFFGLEKIQDRSRVFHGDSQYTPGRVVGHSNVSIRGCPHDPVHAVLDDVCRKRLEFQGLFLDLPELRNIVDCLQHEFFWPFRAPGLKPGFRDQDPENGAGLFLNLAS